MFTVIVILTLPKHVNNYRAITDYAIWPPPPPPPKKKGFEGGEERIAIPQKSNEFVNFLFEK